MSYALYQSDESQTRFDKIEAQILDIVRDRWY